jgi:site-specific DNA recombinase
MRVAVYLRMSSDAQDQSLAQQEEALRAHAGRKGYEIVAVYRDEGISGRGDKTPHRAGFQKMIKDATAGVFRRILCWDQDRFSRADMLEAGGIIEPLRKSRVKLETIAQGVIDWNRFEGRVAYGVMQEGKHQYIRDVGRSTMRGNIRKMASEHVNGYPGGPAPYGYRRVTRLEKHNRISHLEIVEEQAEVVRKIFRWYAEPGGSAHGVASRLATEGIPTARGAKVWRRENVARLLRCPAYIGVIEWGKEHGGAFFVRTATGEIQPRHEYEELQDEGSPPPLMKVHRHERPDLVPPIVSKKLYERVQHLLEERKKATRSAKSIHPLSGLVRCSQCGRTMHACSGYVKGQPCYRCSSHLLPDGGRCQSRRVPEHPLLDAIADELHKTFSTAKAMSVLQKQIKALAEAAATPDVDSLAGLRRQLASLEAKLSDGLERLTACPAGLVPELARKLDEIRKQRDNAAERIANAEREAKATRAEPAGDIIRRMLAHHEQLHRGLRERSSALVNASLRSLGTEIVIDTRPNGDISADIRVGRLVSNFSTPGSATSRPSSWAGMAPPVSTRPAPRRCS